MTVDDTAILACTLFHFVIWTRKDIFYFRSSRYRTYALQSHRGSFGERGERVGNGYGNTIGGYL